MLPNGSSVRLRQDAGTRVKPGTTAGRSASAAAALLLLAGCTGFQAGPKSPLPDIDAAIDGDPARPGSGLSSSYTPEAVNACLAQPLNTDAARTCRDTIVQGLVTAINLRYAEYELGFFDANRYGNFAATVAALGLGTAGSLSGGGAAQVLSGLTAAVTGGRAAFNREVLQEQTAAGLLTAMRTQRNIADLRIRAGLRASALEYPLGVALSDVYALFRAGTIPGALAGFTEAVGVQGQQVQDALAVDTGAVRPLPAATVTPAGTVAPLPRAAPSAPPAAPPARAPAVGPARPAAQPFGHASTASAVALRAWVGAPGLSPAAARARRQQLREEADTAGAAGQPIASFLNDETPANLVRLDQVARRLGLVP